MQNLSPKADLALLICFITWALALVVLVWTPKEWEVVCMVAGLIFLAGPALFAIWSIYMFIKSL